METEMANTLESYHRNELYGSPAARNTRVSNHNFFTAEYLIGPLEM